MRTPPKFHLTCNLPRAAAAGALIGLALLAGDIAPALAAPAAAPQPGVYSATSYGAICDGVLRPTSGAGSVDGAAIQAAVNAAESNPAGGTVLLPPGRCTTSTAINLSTGSPINLVGAISATGQNLTTISDTVNPAQAGGALDILNNGNTVRRLILDEQAYGQAAYIRGDDNTLKAMAILGGPNFFALSVVGLQSGGMATGNQLRDSTVLSLVDHQIYGIGPACDDGIDWSHQDQSLIQDVTFTGTRLNLYQDDNTEVNGFTYYPGPQTCGLNGYEVTQPSSNVTLQNLTMYGSGGIIGSSFSGVSGTNSDITVTNERMEPPTAGAGYTINGPLHGLVINNVQGLTVNTSSFATGSANAQIQFSPTTEASGVLIENTAVTQVGFVGSTNPLLNGITDMANFDNDTFPAVTGTWAKVNDTFVNNSGAPATFSVTGGTWDNQSAGFYLGKASAFIASGLTGYTPAATS
jgi:hypothetical protein